MKSMYWVVAVSTCVSMLTSRPVLVQSSCCVNTTLAMDVRHSGSLMISCQLFVLSMNCKNLRILTYCIAPFTLRYRDIGNHAWILMGINQVHLAGRYQ